MTVYTSTSLGIYKTTFQGLRGWSKECWSISTRGKKVPREWACQCKAESIQLLQGPVEHHRHSMLHHSLCSDTHALAGCGFPHWSAGTVDSKVPRVAYLHSNSKYIPCISEQVVMSWSYSHLGSTTQVCPRVSFHWSTHSHNWTSHRRYSTLLCPLWYLSDTLCDLLLGCVWRREGCWTAWQQWPYQSLSYSNHGVPDESHRWLPLQSKCTWLVTWHTTLYSSVLNPSAQTLRSVDELMSFILVVTFLLIAAVVGLNLFIALLSDTFQRVYDNAQANALLQQVRKCVAIPYLILFCCCCCCCCLSSHFLPSVCYA